MKLPFISRKEHERIVEELKQEIQRRIAHKNKMVDDLFKHREKLRKIRAVIK